MVIRIENQTLYNTRYVVHIHLVKTEEYDALRFHSQIRSTVTNVCTLSPSALLITHSTNIPTGSQMSQSYPVTIMEFEVCRQVGTN